MIKIIDVPLFAGTGSLNPPVVGTGSLDQRAARQEIRSAEQGSLDSGLLDPHASPQGSLNPPVAAATVQVLLHNADLQRSYYFSIS